MSPVWHKSSTRKATCRLSFDKDAAATESGVLEVGHVSSNTGDKGEVNDAQKQDTKFVDTANKLRTFVGQTCVRMTDYLQIITEKLKKEPDMFEKSESNMERLVSIAYLESIANYRLSKWLHQLEPRKCLAPSKPQKQDDHRAADLLSEIKFALTRMEMLSSTLSPLLQKIVTDAKQARPTMDGRPTSPALRRPVGLAQRRGIVDVEELAGICAHLEKILETTEGLAHNPAPLQKVAASIKAVQAMGRFSKLIPHRVKTVEPSSTANASPRPEG
jgi:hypothetical protein